VWWHGEVDAATLQTHYAAADLLVLPSLHEGYGMVVAEALAAGLPVLASRAGALAHTVPAGAGLLVPPGDATALQSALARLITEPGLRTHLAAGARAAAGRLPTWAQQAARFAAVLKDVAVSPPGRPEGEFRRAKPEGTPVSRPGRPKGENRRAPPEARAPRQPVQTEPSAAFSAGWLQQREPFDAVARDAAAARMHLQARLAALRPAAYQPWRVIDLACGTGANLRWLAPRLGGAQQWLVVDHDAALLRHWPASLAAAAAASGGTDAAAAAETIGGSVAVAAKVEASNRGVTVAAEVEASSGDVAAAAEAGAAGAGVAVAARHRAAEREALRFSGAGFDAAIVRRQLDLAHRLDRLPWSSARLVTASALLDLVSEAWLDKLVAYGVAARVAWLFALSVDGRHRWAPRDPQDDAVGALFQAHQQRDKGFGPALGARAAPLLMRALRGAGYRVHGQRSDWRLDGRSDAAALALLRALVDGMAGAAAEQDPAAAAWVQAWRQRRLALAARSSLRVGHVELLALPPR
jgi:hypothetical protein